MALARRRGFDVVAVYPQTLGGDVPSSWVLVGTWVQHELPISSIDNRFQFWATRPAAVRPLERHLRAYDQHLPEGIETVINPMAEYRADVLDREAERGGPGG